MVLEIHIYGLFEYSIVIWCHLVSLPVLSVEVPLATVSIMDIGPLQPSPLPDTTTKDTSY